MTLDYTEIVKDHFFHPRNVGRLNSPSGSGTVGNPSCGDVMTIDIIVEKNIITDAKFQTYGCAAAIASGSITTELVKGKTITECKNLSMDDIIKQLGGLPEEKTHCSNLATEALKKAIKNYQQDKLN
ncbi:MAG: iron-sulfur cluster assembly scaffold protein [Candidatus Thermoplasmatota archaeon]|nr:iron-sulfur cluster assembly scaffold protein [Candidatus Thermoplasmatota archaeon]